MTKSETCETCKGCGLVQRGDTEEDIACFHCNGTGVEKKRENDDD